MRIEHLPEGDYLWRISLSVESRSNVSRLWISEHKMRFGAALPKMGGLGTNVEHRWKGYSRRVMEDSIALIREHGFDVAMLFGIPNFYAKFGYATTLPEVRIAFNAADAEEAISSYQIQKFETRDAAKVLEIYAANNAEQTGTPVRYAARWREFKMGNSWSERAAAFVIVDEADEAIGYFVCDDTEKHCTLSDIGFQSRTVFETIAHFLADYASRMGVARIECAMPPDYPFAIFCRRYRIQDIDP